MSTQIRPPFACMTPYMAADPAIGTGPGKAGNSKETFSAGLWGNPFCNPVRLRIIRS